MHGGPARMREMKYGKIECRIWLGLDRIKDHHKMHIYIYNLRKPNYMSSYEILKHLYILP